METVVQDQLLSTRRIPFFPEDDKNSLSPQSAHFRETYVTETLFVPLHVSLLTFGNIRSKARMEKLTTIIYMYMYNPLPDSEYFQNHFKIRALVGQL
ncbi:Uncharacterized protein TCM_023347 [Theobroma cacao]|uniref:Uncharacterized protein n=1 Tax=Theobroma cacao TaxID=3641 RepID=A0A061F256_THECC|nr:Uncharacterized protein TCM_023347 [Theobroma cacao]